MKPPYLALVGLAFSRVWAIPDIFTTEDMLSTPRPQPAIPSPNGSYALSVVDQWDSNTDKTERRVYILSLNTTVSLPPVSLFNSTSAESSNFIWLDDATIGYLNQSTLFSYSLEFTTQCTVDLAATRGRPFLSFPPGVNPTSLKFEPISRTLAFTGQVWEDGSFENTEMHDKVYEDRRDSAQVYDDLMVRHWDTWRVTGKVWTLGIVQIGKFKTNWAKVENREGAFVNVLNGTGLVSQTDPIGSSSYAITSSTIAVAMKPNHSSHAMHTREDIYVLPLPSLAENPRHITPYDHGAINSVVFSPNGKKLAWLEMKKDGYESDKRVVVVFDLEHNHSQRWTEEWDRSPDSIAWAVDGSSLYLLAKHHGRVLPYHLAEANHLPTPLLFNASTTSISPLTNTTLLISCQSLVSPLDEYILKRTHPEIREDIKNSDRALRELDIFKVTHWSKEHIRGRLEGQRGEEFWFSGAEEKEVMGWAIKPRGWKPDQISKYPMAFFIHGGPQSAWEDAWSTRWNPALFASQGYFVIAINPTGSTGYGQNFTDAIQGDWGGKPFKDLLAGYQAALAKYPEINQERTTALGASYGGYMINWINGHNDQFGFKSLVCHDGVFDTITTFFSTEELYFPVQDFKGTPWTNRATYEKWSPINHVTEWSTPQLVIQGGKDYRLENSQGIGAFTALQVRGVASRFIYFPDENHWVLKPHNSIKWHFEVFNWLEEWVGVGRNQNANGQESANLSLIIQ
ncbi:uncharacterized protein L203_102842 [Cryptococcus depauperatus CBS 7841]|uniref:Dipeptidyl-peptidase V n=1 Tax=Cryptococcus depauperatus CBS 7841 TaxID=1295531 RepID=A0A1E3IBB8_9TREE|nr:peptidase [Cryptococcus depauperatus CBS 7841]